MAHTNKRSGRPKSPLHPPAAPSIALSDHGVELHDSGFARLFGCKKLFDSLRLLARCAGPGITGAKHAIDHLLGWCDVATGRGCSPTKARAPSRRHARGGAAGCQVS